MRHGVLAGVLLLSTGLFACSFDDVDLRGKRCPCAVGWVCDVEANRCVETIAAGMDAGPSREGGPRDAGVDASRTDAPGVDAGVDAGEALDGGPDSVCSEAAGASAYFCDGFELGDGFDGWNRGPYESDGTATRTSEAYRGGSALRAETLVERGFAAVGTTFLPVTVDGELWLRAYYYVPSGWEAYHLDLGSVRSLSEPFTGIALALGSEDFAYLYVDEIAMPFYGGSVVLPRDAWACVEVHVVVSDTAGSVELLIDGARVVASDSPIDTLPPGGFGFVDVGVPYTDEGQEGTTVLVDEVAVGPLRIPCDP